MEKDPATIERSLAEANERLVNLTPHEVVLVTPWGNVHVPPSGSIARVESIPRPLFRLGGVVVNAESYGDVAGVPPEQPGRYYLVSALVRLALPNRTDLLSPGQLVRDEQGRVVGCQSLIGNPPDDME